MPGFDLLEDLLDARQWQPPRRVAEVLEHGLLRERSLGPEEADLQRFLLRQASRHDLAEQAQEHLVRERAVVAIQDAPQHLRLALGAIIVNGRLQRTFRRADAARPAGALGDQGLDLPIDAVDALARLRQGGNGLRGRRRRLAWASGHG